MHRAIALALLACIWSYGTNRHGKQIEFSDIGGTQLVLSLFKHEPRRYWEKERKRLADPKTDRATRNDHAVALLHLGQTAEAVRILSALEKERPGEYPTAANLGTAYELAGDDTKALQWITESIRRNRDAHSSTEWLHVRILEAKLARAKDPQWFAKNSVLGIDTGTDLVPKLPKTWPRGNDGRPVRTDAAEQALYYQLHERLQFVPAPDPVVADLFYDWANILYNTQTLESAEALYLQAIGFGVQRPQARERLAHVQGLLAKYKKKS